MARISETSYSKIKRLHGRNLAKFLRKPQIIRHIRYLKRDYSYTHIQALRNTALRILKNTPYPNNTDTIIKDHYSTIIVHNNLTLLTLSFTHFNSFLSYQPGTLHCII